MKLAH